MDINFILAILDNAYRLILLGFLYEISYLISDRYRRFLPYITGLLAGLAGLTIMTEYYRVAAGIVYDTRTILISLTALVFGLCPLSLRRSLPSFSVSPWAVSGLYRGFYQSWLPMGSGFYGDG